LENTRRWDVILKCIGWDAVDWIHLAEDGGNWGAVVNKIVNITVS